MEMNREELEAMLNEMDAEERELALAADDAYDRLYAYRLHKQYGVEVECNPDGDRTKVKIDGVVMTQSQFAAWLMSKQMAEAAENLRRRAYEPELPSELTIPYEDMDGEYDAVIGNDNAVKNYLRETYDHYLAGGTEPSIVWEDDYADVSNIQWGRKR